MISLAKRNPCPHCEEGKPVISHGGVSLSILRTGKAEIFIGSNFAAEQQFDFCPMCGRKLRDKIKLTLSDGTKSRKLCSNCKNDCIKNGIIACSEYSPKENLL